MATIRIALTVVLAVLSVLLCIIILLQSKRSAGLGAVSGNASGEQKQSKLYGRCFGKIYKNWRCVIHVDCFGN